MSKVSSDPPLFEDEPGGLLQAFKSLNLSQIQCQLEVLGPEKAINGGQRKNRRFRHSFVAKRPRSKSDSMVGPADQSGSGGPFYQDRDRDLHGEVDNEMVVDDDDEDDDEDSCYQMRTKASEIRASTESLLVDSTDVKVVQELEENQLEELCPESGNPRDVLGLERRDPIHQQEDRVSLRSRKTCLLFLKDRLSSPSDVDSGRVSDTDTGTTTSTNSYSRSTINSNSSSGGSSTDPRSPSPEATRVSCRRGFVSNIACGGGAEAETGAGPVVVGGKVRNKVTVFVPYSTMVRCLNETLERRNSKRSFADRTTLHDLEDTSSRPAGVPLPRTEAAHNRRMAKRIQHASSLQSNPEGHRVGPLGEEPKVNPCLLVLTDDTEELILPCPPPSRSEDDEASGGLLQPSRVKRHLRRFPKKILDIPPVKVKGHKNISTHQSSRKPEDLRLPTSSGFPRRKDLCKLLGLNADDVGSLLIVPDEDVRLARRVALLHNCDQPQVERPQPDEWDGLTAPQALGRPHCTGPAGEQQNPSGAPPGRKKDLVRFLGVDEEVKKVVKDDLQQESHDLQQRPGDVVVVHRRPKTSKRSASTEAEDTGHLTGSASSGTATTGNGSDLSKRPVSLLINLSNLVKRSSGRWGSPSHSLREQLQGHIQGQNIDFGRNQGGNEGSPVEGNDGDHDQPDDGIPQGHAELQSRIESSTKGQGRKRGQHRFFLSQGELGQQTRGQSSHHHSIDSIFRPDGIAEAQIAAAGSTASWASSRDGGLEQQGHGEGQGDEVKKPFKRKDLIKFLGFDDSDSEEIVFIQNHKTSSSSSKEVQPLTRTERPREVTLSALTKQGGGRVTKEDMVDPCQGQPHRSPKTTATMGHGLQGLKFKWLTSQTRSKAILKRNPILDMLDDMAGPCCPAEEGLGPAGVGSTFDGKFDRTTTSMDSSRCSWEESEKMATGVERRPPSQGSLSRETSLQRLLRIAEDNNWSDEDTSLQHPTGQGFWKGTRGTRGHGEALSSPHRGQPVRSALRSPNSPSKRICGPVMFRASTRKVVYPKREKNHRKGLMGSSPNKGAKASTMTLGPLANATFVNCLVPASAVVIQGQTYPLFFIGSPSLAAAYLDSNPGAVRSPSEGVLIKGAHPQQPYILKDSPRAIKPLSSTAVAHRTQRVRQRPSTATGANGLGEPGLSLPGHNLLTPSMEHRLRNSSSQYRC